MRSLDDSENLAGRVAEACARGEPLRIQGGGSKDFYAGPCTGQPLSTRTHSGIVHYEPTELVLTARSGTPLTAIEAVLAESGQMLGFEPPHFGSDASWGGTVACGLSGPRRPWAGSLRDAVLGCRIVDGRGKVLSFGGQVMKNVAGFDVSRLMTGALGTLGLLLEISVKVLPKPECEITLSFECSHVESRERMIRWGGSGLPVTGLAWDGRLYLRLAGAEPAVSTAVRRIGGDRAEDAAGFWNGLREHAHDFFSGEADLWRLSLPPAADTGRLSGAWLIDWGGAQRWLRTDADPDEVFAAAQAAGGHARLFRTLNPQAPRCAPLAPALAALHRRVRAVFDPAGILNRGLYPEAA
ncbi:MULTISPECIES: glycolate oxidase subunit GlcE [Methylococcus]|uniref:Glycolate oxidase subunit GlcE n=1 Tax=Methylococcus capsulatus TaxID=414 RepID=A0ABZ2F4E3_METCP|nr:MULTISPECIES: glycolate oxidase subunit GlcE [Methylococcus]MDF9391567.1 glycolate oxidase subunit GlcE [Methylococcus capsulatus]